MLVLSRKNGEAIVIDGAIKIQVIEVKGHVVRLGIEAPKEIPVHRSEIYEQLRETETALAPPEKKLTPKSRSGLHDLVASIQRGRIVEPFAAARREL